MARILIDSCDDFGPGIGRRRADGVATRPAGQTLGLLVEALGRRAEPAVIDVARGLERQGVPLVVYALAGPHGSPGTGLRAPVCQVPDRPWRQPLPTLAGQLRALAASPARWAAALNLAWSRGRPGLLDFARAGWLAERLRRDGVDHLHAFGLGRAADLAELAAAMGAAPFSIAARAGEIHGGDADMLRRKALAARVTLAGSDVDGRALRAAAPGAAVQRLYPGVDAAVFHPSRRRGPGPLPLVLSVGRLADHAGLDTLVVACARLRQRRLPFRCEIVGAGDDRRLRSLIDGLGLAGHVRLTGRLSRKRLLERYAAADVVVQPGRTAAGGDREGIPAPLLEAMAIGAPVVATRVPGIAELVQDGHNGLAVEPEDADALAAAVARLLEQPALGRVLALAARRTVTTHFDLDHNLRLLLQLLETRDAPTPRHAVA